MKGHTHECQGDKIAVLNVDFLLKFVSPDDIVYRDLVMSILFLLWSSGIAYRLRALRWQILALKSNDIASRHES